MKNQWFLFAAFISNGWLKPILQVYIYVTAVLASRHGHLAPPPRSRVAHAVQHRSLS